MITLKEDGVRNNPSLQDLQDAPYSDSFMNDRAELTIGGKRYVKLRKNKWEYQPEQERALGSFYTDEQMYDILKK